MYSYEISLENVYKTPNCIDFNEVEKEMYIRLEKALFNEEIIVYYQPQIEIASNRIVGVEALARWCTPETGFISPDIFIRLAEKTDLILAIEEHILRTACRQNKIWQDKGYPSINMSINVSPNQFRNRHFTTYISDILHETGFDANLLILEITESKAIEDIHSAAQVIDMLKNMGISFELDDFGTGYSSFSYLSNFHIDSIKIDKSFIKNINKEIKNRIIIKSIIDLAHNLNLTVTGEGIETYEQLKILKEQSCDKIQGYFYCKPLPDYEIENYIKNGSI